MAGMLRARRLDGYDDEATVDEAALLHDEGAAPLLTSMMHLGRWPLEVAPTVCVQLFDKRRIRCWRTDKVEGLAPWPDGDIEADGVITATRIEKSRVDRAYSVSDVTLTVNGTQLKLWLPRRVAVRPGIHWAKLEPRGGRDAPLVPAPYDEGRLDGFVDAADEAVYAEAARVFEANLRRFAPDCVT